MGVLYGSRWVQQIAHRDGAWFNCLVEYLFLHPGYLLYGSISEPHLQQDSKSQCIAADCQVYITPCAQPCRTASAHDDYVRECRKPGSTACKGSVGR